MNSLIRKYPTIVALACFAWLGSGNALAGDLATGHHAHAATTKSSTTAAEAYEFPALDLVMPIDGESIESPVAIVFQTSADLDQMTMSAAKLGTHLHIGVDGRSMMPMRDQIFSAGKNLYVFVIDFPMTPGRHELSIYWAGGDHETISSSIRKAFVNVRKR